MTVGTLDDWKNSKVTDLTKDGNCTACGSCCSRLLPLYPQEKTNIKKYIKKHNIKPVKTVMPLAKPAEDLNCPFCDYSKPLKCLIYEVRPEICRKFVCNKNEQHGMKLGAVITDMRAEFFGEENFLSKIMEQRLVGELGGEE